MTYILLVNLYLVVFYAFYEVFLSKETFFRWNRFYLLAGIFCAFTLPLVSYPSGDFFTNGYQSYLYTFQLDESVVIGSNADAGISKVLLLKNMLRYLYIGGCVVTFLGVLVGLIRTIRLLRAKPSGQAFSFFRMVRVGFALQEHEAIERHEKVHADEWHSFDILLVQAVKIFGWFNPIVYRYERAMRLQHEYIADEKAALHDQVGYAELLVAQAMGVERRLLAHTFSSKNLLKHRVKMLVCDKSPKKGLLKYTLLLPLVVAMAIFSIACNQEEHTPAIPDMTTGTEESNVLFHEVEINPEPPGGMRAFMEYIGRNYDYPQEAIETGVIGKLSVSFVVEKDGSLTDIKVIEDLGYGTGDAAVRVVRDGQKWSPGIQNGRPVRVAYTLPIRLNLQQ